MKGNNTFRRAVAAVARIISRVKARFFGGRAVNPMLRDPYTRQRTHIGTTANRVGSKRYSNPPCVPGTIVYHDMLVRHFGRRYADKIGGLIRQGRLDLLPSGDDFARTAEQTFGRTA